MYGKERSGTVPGAVATGSTAPGRYRSRYRAAPQPGRINESSDTVYSFANRSRIAQAGCRETKTNKEGQNGRGAGFHGSLQWAFASRCGALRRRIYPCLFLEARVFGYNHALAMKVGSGQWVVGVLTPSLPTAHRQLPTIFRGIE